MNLTNIFNFKFAKENIKKSKGGIMLSLFLVPLITFFYVIFVLNKSYYTSLVTETEMMWPNIIGMFVIPVILSYILFGYVFKKKSVDFVNSMPINRKTIFITNTIVGIILITLIQILNFIGLNIANIACSNVEMFTEMIKDICVYMWFGYVFLFIISNLAMTFSGTFITQIVLTLLITFLVPFCMVMFNSYFDMNVKFENKDIDLYDATTSIYTIPSNIIVNTTYGESIYSIASIVRTVILSIICFIIGIITFQKRKMEKAEESFSSDIVHLIIKSLTVFPIAVLLYTTDGEISYNIFCIIGLAFYYAIYDYIVVRKVNILKNIIAFVCIIVISYGICIEMGKIYERNSNMDLYITKDDVKAISVEFNHNGSYNDYLVTDEDFIKNQEIIELVCDEILINKDYVISSEEDYFNLKIFMKIDNKVYYTYIDVSPESFDKIVNTLSTDEKFVKREKEKFMNDSYILIDERILDNDYRNILENLIRNEIEKLSLQEIAEKLYNTSNNIYIQEKYYKNHQIKSSSMPIDFSEEILKMVAKEENEFTKKVINMTSNYEKKQSYFYENYYLNKGNYNKAQEMLSMYGQYYSSNFDFTKDQIKTFIQNASEEVDFNQDYVVIGEVNSYLTSGSYFFTNDIDGVYEILIKENEEYINAESDTYTDDYLYTDFNEENLFNDEYVYTDLNEENLYYENIYTDI